MPTIIMSTLVQWLPDDKSIVFQYYDTESNEKDMMVVSLKYYGINRKWFERQGWFGVTKTSVVIKGTKSIVPHLILTEKEAMIIVECFRIFATYSYDELSGKKHVIDFEHEDKTPGTIQISISRGKKSDFGATPLVVHIWKQWPGNMKKLTLQYAEMHALINAIKQLV